MLGHSVCQRIWCAPSTTASASLTIEADALRQRCNATLCIKFATICQRFVRPGLTFSDVAQRLKFDLAKRHLADDALSISEIAWLLGYQDVSAFTHAFKRWTGRTPRAMRRDEVIVKGRKKKVWQ